MFKNTQRYKPKYKTLLVINENLYNKKKILKFNKRKWLKSVLLKKLKNKIKYNRFFCLFDHFLNYRPKANFFYLKRFKHNLLYKKKFLKLFGFFKIKTLKSIKFKVKSLSNNNKSNRFLNKLESYYTDFFESSLDNIIYKSYLSISIRESRNLITKGFVYVNNIKMLKFSYKIKKGDLITFDPSIHKKLLKNFTTITLSNTSVFILPDYMEVNYKTLQIIIFSSKIDKKYYGHYPFKLEFKRLNRFLL